MSHHDHRNKVRECIVQAFSDEADFHVAMASVTDGPERAEHLAQAELCKQWRLRFVGLPSATCH
jgi:hypothetical protein